MDIISEIKKNFEKYEGQDLTIREMLLYMLYSDDNA